MPLMSIMMKHSIIITSISLHSHKVGSTKLFSMPLYPVKLRFPKQISKAMLLSQKRDGGTNSLLKPVVFFFFLNGMFNKHIWV